MFYLLEDAWELFDAVEHLNPIIVTGVPLGGWAEPQKLAWAAERFPGTQMIVCLSREKRLHMKYRHLCEEAGGIFVHHTSTASSLAKLRWLGVLKDCAPRSLLSEFRQG